MLINNLKMLKRVGKKVKKQSDRNEQGIAHLLLVVVAVVIIAIVAFAAIKVAGSNKSNTTSKGGSSASIQSSCLATYHDATLCKFASFSQDFDKIAYTATLTTTQDGVDSSMTLKHDTKDNTSLDGTGGGASISSVELDGTTYVKSSGSDTWISYPASSTSDTSTDPTSNLNIAVGASGLKFSAQGTEACGSLTCYKYKITDSSTPDATQYVWFDNKDYKLREWKYTSGSDSTDMSVSYEAVNITKPSPVQSFSAQ